jgi:hypothetical protein
MRDNEMRLLLATNSAKRRFLALGSNGPQVRRKSVHPAVADRTFALVLNYRLVSVWEYRRLCGQVTSTLEQKDTGVFLSTRLSHM